jgi:hypothetical protein
MRGNTDVAHLCRAPYYRKAHPMERLSIARLIRGVIGWIAIIDADQAPLAMYIAPRYSLVSERRRT